MKLNNKILIGNIILTVVILSITSVGMYYLVNQTIYEELDNHLLQHKTDLLNQLQDNPATLNEIQELGGLGSYEWIEIIPGRGELAPEENRFATIDTLRHKTAGAETEAYRRLTTSITVNNQGYTLKIYEEVAAWDRISMTILVTLLAGLLVWILLLYIVNQVVFSKILTPFYESVHSLEEISDPSHLRESFPRSDTYEIDVLNRALNTMMKQIRASFEDQKKFIQNASHELLTPLSIIRQKAEKILSNSDKLDRGTVEAAGEIQQTAVRLSRLSNALLLISRVENRQFNLDERIELREIVGETLEELCDFINLKELTLEKNFETPITIQGNRELIHSAVYNIVQNAVKFSPAASVISLSMHCNSGTCEFTVSDQGPGIPADLVNSVFDRFKRGQNHHAENVDDNSTGLGLSIVKSICDLHGFQCTAKNRPEGGAEITIRFSRTGTK